jgi:stringent starvation protein B
MAEMTSTKPYMIRAIHEWCVDNQLTPHLLVEVNSKTKVPMAYVKDGEIVLNLNYSATKDLHFTNEAITFSARFSGVSNNLYVPIEAIKGIFARENGQGMFFELTPEVTNEIKNNEIDPASKNISPEVKKTTLKLVK